MSIIKLRCLIAALSVGLSGVALAQDDKDVRSDHATDHPVYRHDNRGGNGHDRDRDDRSRYDRSRNGHDQGRYDDRGRYDRPGYRGDRDPRWEGRGAGPDHAFYRGGRLPVEYRSRGYVIDDWRAYRLSAPPRGYHWVQAGGDYVLVAITTGIIADILLNQ